MWICADFAEGALRSLPAGRDLKRTLSWSRRFYSLGIGGFSNHQERPEKMLDPSRRLWPGVGEADA